MSTESTFTSGASAQTRRTRCREALQGAAAGHAARLDGLPSEATPRLGDTYLSRSTADFPVEWLVVEQASDRRGRRCRVLPVDEFPLVGSEDFRFPADALGGPQVGRCGFTIWLDADRFEPDLRTGALSPGHLRTLQHKLGDVASRRRPSADLVADVKPSEAEVDGDPEYHRWCERTLRRAVAALDTRQPAPPDNIVPLFGAPPAPRPLWTRLLAVAAVLLLTLVPAAWTVWQLTESLAQERQRVASLLDASGAQATRLEALADEKRQAGEKASRLESELADLRRAVGVDQAALQQSFETRLAALNRELAQTVASKIVENIPVLRLDHRSRSTRTGAIRGTASFNVGGYSQVLLEIDVHDATPFTTYEACLEGGSASRFCLDGLTLQEGRFLRVALPVDRLHEELTVTLNGEKRGQITELDERYKMRIER